MEREVCVSLTVPEQICLVPEYDRPEYIKYVCVGGGGAVCVFGGGGVIARARACVCV